MNKRLLSILLSLMVMMSMCFAGTIGVFAGDEGEAGVEVLEEGVAPDAANAEAEFVGETGFAMEAADETTVYSGETLTPIDFSKISDGDPEYSTVSANSTFAVNMHAGTLIVIHNDSSHRNILVNEKSCDSYVKLEDGSEYKHANFYYVSNGNPTLSVLNSGTKFRVYYAPETAKLKASASKKPIMSAGQRTRMQLPNSLLRSRKAGILCSTWGMQPERTRCITRQKDSKTLNI